MPPGGFVSSKELDAEYITVDPEEDFDGWYREAGFLESMEKKPVRETLLVGLLMG
jgi:hypothetical protein